MEQNAIKDIELIINNTNNLISKLQQKFLESNLCEIVDTSLDIGIKLLLPDTIEDEVIEIKNTIMKEGVIGGIKKAVDCAINFGKNVYGITTGNFESISQLETALKSGGTLDAISNLLDKGINFATSKGLIKNDIKKKLKTGKKVFIKTIDDRLSNKLKEQKDYLKSVNQYVDKWYKAFNEKDFEKMEEIFKELKKYVKETVPFKSTIEEYKKIETLHNVIKNNGKKFDLTDNELELVNALSVS